MVGKILFTVISLFALVFGGDLQFNEAACPTECEFTNPLIWNPQGVPSPGDSVFIDAENGVTISINNGTAVTVGNLQMTGNITMFILYPLTVLDTFNITGSEVHVGATMLGVSALELNSGAGLYVFSGGAILYSGSLLQIDVNSTLSVLPNTTFTAEQPFMLLCTGSTMNVKNPALIYISNFVALNELTISDCNETTIPLKFGTVVAPTEFNIISTNLEIKLCTSDELMVDETSYLIVDNWTSVPSQLEVDGMLIVRQDLTFQNEDIDGDGVVSLEEGVTVTLVENTTDTSVVSASFYLSSGSALEVIGNYIVNSVSSDWDVSGVTVQTAGNVVFSDEVAVYGFLVSADQVTFQQPAEFTNCTTGIPNIFTTNNFTCSSGVLSAVQLVVTGDTIAAPQVNVLGGLQVFAEETYFQVDVQLATSFATIWVGSTTRIVVEVELATVDSTVIFNLTQATHSTPIIQVFGVANFYGSSFAFSAIPDSLDSVVLVSADSIVFDRDLTVSAPSGFTLQNKDNQITLVRNGSNTNPSDEKPHKSKWWVSIIIILCAIAVAGVGYLVFTRRRRNRYGELTRLRDFSN